MGAKKIGVSTVHITKRIQNTSMYTLIFGGDGKPSHSMPTKNADMTHTTWIREEGKHSLIKNRIFCDVGKNQKRITVTIGNSKSASPHTVITAKGILMRQAHFLKAS